MINMMLGSREAGSLGCFFAAAVIWPILVRLGSNDSAVPAVAAWPTLLRNSLLVCVFIFVPFLILKVQS